MKPSDRRWLSFTRNGRAMKRSLDQTRDMLAYVSIQFRGGGSAVLENVEALYDWPASPCAVYRDAGGIVYRYPLFNIESVVVTPAASAEWMNATDTKEGT